VRNRVTEDRHRFQLARDAADDRGNTSAINRNLKQSNLALAIREEADKIKQHYDNNTTDSEACRRSDTRVEKLHTRLEKRRCQAYKALTTQAQRAENAFFASRDAYNLINRELIGVVSTLRQLEDELSAVIDEEARLNRGRGKKRQRRTTQRKRHFKKH
jgi:hypothetical protein